MRNVLTLSLFLVLSSGCMTPERHAETLPGASDTRLTVGLIQKEIREGMTQGEVVEVLGSPNLVTRESNGGETWVYDKFQTETAFTKDSGGASILVLGYEKSAGATVRRQRTLTVILKFKEGTLDAFSYHSTSF